MAYITGLTQDEKQYGSKKKIAITATAGQTVFVPGFDYIPGSNVLEVFINGVKQSGSAYVESQGFITLTEGVVAGDIVEIVSDVVEHRLTGEVEWLRRNYGPLVSDPTSRPNGDVMVAGDEYFNTASGKKRYYNGVIWVDNSTTYWVDVMKTTNIAPPEEGMFTFEKISDTQIKIKMKGGDGIVRSTIITLS